VSDREHPDQNRGFGFLTFYNHAAAEKARRRLEAGFRCACLVCCSGGCFIIGCPLAPDDARAHFSTNDVASERGVQDNGAFAWDMSRPGHACRGLSWQVVCTRGQRFCVGRLRSLIA
jgi:hypothetical protein